MADNVTPLQDVVKNEPKTAPSKETLIERNMRAALERDEQKKQEEAEAAAAAEAERKNDGRQYDMEVEGFNIGDSLMRRMQFMDNAVEKGQEQMLNEEMSENIEGVDDVDTTAPENDIVKEADTTIEDEINDFDLDDPSDDFEPAPVYKSVDEVASTPEVVSEPEVKEEAKEDEDEIKPTSSGQDQIIFDEDDFSDIDLEDEEEDDEGYSDTVRKEATDEDIEKIRKEAAERLRPKARKITIMTKEVSVNRAMGMDTTPVNTADFPLIHTGKLITMSRIKGYDIDTVVNTEQDRITDINRLNEMYTIFYNHIVGDKPAFREWLMTTANADLQSMYMAFHKATYFGSNFVPMNCTNEKCEHVFLTKNIDYRDMIDFKNDESKKRFDDILAGKQVSVSSVTDVIPLSDTIGVTLKTPSIYNAQFEQESVDAKFREKYAKVITFLMYIDKFYYIDSTGGAYPIRVKTDPKSVVKNFKYKVASYAKVIMNLPSDAYGILEAVIYEFDQGTHSYGISFKLPEIECPQCGTIIPATPMSAAQILFSRHRLNLLTVQS